VSRATTPFNALVAEHPISKAIAAAAPNPRLKRLVMPQSWMYAKVRGCSELESRDRTVGICVGRSLSAGYTHETAQWIAPVQTAIARVCVPTKRFNETVKRNLTKFPADFMFGSRPKSGPL
jgi:hypothetical protein